MVVPRGRHLSFTTRMSRSLSSFIVPRAPDPNRMMRSGSTAFTMLVTIASSSAWSGACLSARSRVGSRFASIACSGCQYRRPPDSC